MSRAQYQKNLEIEAFIAKKEKDSEGQINFSIDEVHFISQFTGYGGLGKYGAKGKSLLSEYYTEDEVISKMVGLAWQHGYKEGPVLEPSCGTGRILRYFHPDTQVDAYEINPTSQVIAKANCPTFNIYLQYFNEMFVTRNGQSLPFKPKYKLVIGNPPYGRFTGKFTLKEKKITAATQYEEYFVTRGLDLLMKNGLLVYILPSSFLSGKQSRVKDHIILKADLVDAYRLPVNAFKQTNIGTDIIVLRKK